MPPTRTAICLVIYTDPGEFEILLQFDNKTHPRNFGTFNGSAIPQTRIRWSYAKITVSSKAIHEMPFRAPDEHQDSADWG
jgi:hypothetical protein